MIKYVKIATFYKQAIEYYYLKFPDIVKESYSVQFRHFMDQYYGLSDSYEKEFIELGMSAQVIPANVAPLLAKWSEENGLAIGNTDDLILSWLKKESPDVIYVDDVSFSPIEYWDHLRQQIPSVKLLIGNCCSPYNVYTLQVYHKFDFVFCCCNQLANELRVQGIKAHVVMHGFDTNILKKIPHKTKDIDLLFTGSIIPGKGFHQQRNNLINTIVKSKINISIYGNIKRQCKILIRLKQCIYLIYSFLKKIDVLNLLRYKKLNKKILSGGMPQFIQIDKALEKKVYAPEFGLDMFDLLGQSNICLNIHGDISSIDAANMRLFEATGMGACLLTDWKENMCTLFDEGVEVVTYKNADDCVEKIKWLLNHPDLVKNIGLAGQRKCVEMYSVKARAKEIYDVIVLELNNA